MVGEARVEAMRGEGREGLIYTSVSEILKNTLIVELIPSAWAAT